MNRFYVESLDKSTQDRSSNATLSYIKASKTIQNYPLLLTSGSHAKKDLKGVGAKIAKFLNDLNCAGDGSVIEKEDIVESEVTETVVLKVKRKSKKYRPLVRSGGYGILICLLLHADKNSKVMSKSEIIRLGQSYTTASFTSHASAKIKHTAWSAMKKLVEEELVIEAGHPKVYSLTDEGHDLATHFNAAHGTISDLECEEVEIVERDFEIDDYEECQNRGIFDTEIHRLEMEDEKTAIENYSGKYRLFEPDSYDILLVLDTREVRGRQVRDQFQFDLEKVGVKVLTMALTLGDICWVARSKTDLDDLIVLDIIIERKTHSDLVASIQDGRFKEQKFRLSASGMDVIYLIEGLEANLEQSIVTSLTETMIVNDFFVKQTFDYADTINYIASITKILKARYEHKQLKIIEEADLTNHKIIRLALKRKGEQLLLSLAHFAIMSTKTKQFTIFDIWQRQLLTLRGVSVEKTVVLSKKFICLDDLISQLQTCYDENEMVMLLTSCSEGSNRKCIGKALALKIIACVL